MDNILLMTGNSFRMPARCREIHRLSCSEHVQGGAKGDVWQTLEAGCLRLCWLPEMRMAAGSSMLWSMKGTSSSSSLHIRSEGLELRVQGQ